MTVVRAGGCIPFVQEEKQGLRMDTNGTDVVVTGAVEGHVFETSVPYDLRDIPTVDINLASNMLGLSNRHSGRPSTSASDD